LNFQVDIFGDSVDVPLRVYPLRVLILRSNSVIGPEPVYIFIDLPRWS